jgi:chromosome segregation ATPase
MTLRNFPPADRCDPEDLDNLADLVVRDPRASWNLAGSREHIEALCRRYQALAQDLDQERGKAVTLEMQVDGVGRLRADAAALERDNRALQERIAALTNERDRLAADLGAAAMNCADIALERDRLQLRADHESRMKLERAREREQAIADLDAARQAIADREDEIARVNNERQAEVNEAADQRERADTAESVAEIFEATARAALAILARGRGAALVDLAELARAVDGRLSRALVRERQVTARLAKQVEDTALLLDQQRETHEANDRIRSAFASSVPAICAVTVEDLNHRLDAELAANPDVGPLHHARDQREQDEPERVIRTTLDAALVPCEHRTDVPCAGCEMRRRHELFTQGSTTP